MNLLLDLGNTRLKWALGQQVGLGEVRAINYRQTDFTLGLYREWQGLPPPRRIGVASVSGQAILQPLLNLCRELWPHAELLLPRSSAAGFGVKNAYIQPQRLGVDRWLALIAAHRMYGGNLCVVDCGSAITLDVVRADGSHAGGLIMPGLRMMKRALAADAAQLPMVETEYALGLALETQAAIANGVLAAAVGMVDNALQNHARDCDVLLTGGDGERVANALPHPALFDADLVLKGLSIYCQGE